MASRNLVKDLLASTIRGGARSSRASNLVAFSGGVDSSVVAALVLPALVGVPLGAALAAVGLWLLGIAALGFALPITLASVVATPLWAAAYVGTEASEAWTRVWNAALDQQHQHGT